MAKNHTIVYVFGPAQSEAKYKNDELLERRLGEWVKIGETSVECDPAEVDWDWMKAKAMARIMQEVRTGIPVQSKIYDLFMFPFRQQTDELIRSRLCDDMFDVENSKAINRANTDADVIPAGREFVYGVRRSNIKFAVQSYDHDLMVAALETGDTGEIARIGKVFLLNDISIGEGEADEPLKETGDAGKPGRNERLNLDMILSVGDEVVLMNGKNAVIDGNGQLVRAKYVGNMKFECRGVIACASPLAEIMLTRYRPECVAGKIKDGNRRWARQDRKLFELRKN